MHLQSVDPEGLPSMAGLPVGSGTEETVSGMHDLKEMVDGPQWSQVWSDCSRPMHESSGLRLRCQKPSPKLDNEAMSVAYPITNPSTPAAPERKANHPPARRLAQKSLTNILA